MRVVIQRALNGSVVVDGKTVGEIGKGIVVLLGIRETDNYKDAACIVRKTLSSRLWPDAKGKDWNASVMDLGLDVLVISQFTLYGSIKKKPSPDFHVSMKNARAGVFFEEVVEMFKAEYPKGNIQTGEFGADMKVNLTNDGPVTLIVDSSDWNVADIPMLTSWKPKDPSLFAPPPPLPKQVKSAPAIQPPTPDAPETPANNQ